MRSNSLTSSFNKPAGTFVLTLVLLIFCEMAAYKVPIVSLKDVPRAIQNSQSTEPADELVLMGDSVVTWFYESTGGEEKHKLKNLAAIGYIEVTGYYFLLRDYLENHPETKQVLFIAHNPFGLNLNNVEIESQFARWFTKWDQIIEVWNIKHDVLLTMNMIFYKSSELYFKRAEIQSIFRIYHNVQFDQDQTFITPAKPGYNFKDSISEKYFVKILQLLKEKNIKLYYYYPPIIENYVTMPATLLQRPSPLDYFETRIQQYQKEYSNFVFVKDPNLVFPKEYFEDNVHLNRKGKMAYLPEFQKIVAEVKKDLK